MSVFKKSTSIITAFVLGAVIFGINLVWSYGEPTASPPGNNISSPLNIGSDGQSKAGGLILNTAGAVNGLIVALGKVGIGVINPSEALEVLGNIKLNGVLPTYTITNVATPIAGSDVATKDFVLAQMGAGGGYRCFFSMNDYNGNLGGKSGADNKCALEETGFKLGTARQWFTRAGGASSLTPWVHGGSDCSSWASSAGSKNGDTVAWDATNHEWGSGSAQTCNTTRPLLCCNFDPSGYPAPSSLAASLGLYGWVNLTWTNNTISGTDIKIERKAGAGTYSEIASLPFSGSPPDSYNDPSPKNTSTTYTYRVYDYSATSRSPYSNEASASMGATICGNGVLETGEQCDSNTGRGSTACGSDCKWVKNYDGDSATSIETGGNDCHDVFWSVYPGAPGSTYRDGLDNDCNGQIDEEVMIVKTYTYADPRSSDGIRLHYFASQFYPNGQPTGTTQFCRWKIPGSGYSNSTDMSHDYTNTRRCNSLRETDGVCTSEGNETGYMGYIYCDVNVGIGIYK